MSNFYRMEQAVRELIGSREVLPPMNYRKQWDCSRLVKEPDGTTTPVLWIIALAKFPNCDPKIQKPYWVDKDHTNECFANVELRLKDPEKHAQPRQYKAPAGSAEYYKEYRQRNKEKSREYQKRYYNKMRAALRAQRDAERPKSTPLQEQTESKFFAALAAVEGSVPPEVDRRASERSDRPGGRRATDPDVSIPVEKGKEL